MKAKIIDIKRFAVHDGDGIRTTVFFKGCPLKCEWCHNPEGISFVPQIEYIEKKCINCGECVRVCEAHFLNNGKHVFDRAKCVVCEKCENVCLGKALKYYGKEITVEELLPVLLEDKDFYDCSNGGVTLSGGECLCQADFCLELLKQLKAADIHTAVDTCGYVSRESIYKVVPYTDVFLYDIKAFDEKTHIKCTGKSNKIILENLKYIDSLNKKIEVRIPFVPTMNDNQMSEIGNFLRDIKNLTKVKVLPYHNYAGSKYIAVAMENTMPKVEPPTTEQIRQAEDILKSYGLNIVSR